MLEPTVRTVWRIHCIPLSVPVTSLSAAQRQYLASPIDAQQCIQSHVSKDHRPHPDRTSAHLGPRYLKSSRKIHRPTHLERDGLDWIGLWNVCRMRGKYCLYRAEEQRADSTLRRPTFRWRECQAEG